MSTRVMLVAVALLGAACRPSEDTPRAPASAAARAADANAALLAESEVRDQDIEFYARRVEGDPSGAIDLARLASLYLQRSRETGDPGDAVRAEE
ncbi:hypothetical protein, partial [Bradyrhizobium sp. NBAIM08]|uniref:hypothetical protein n=1 Tax=Bradyrhizobium sp. NBAIM08 TaxID=2793815 RepID=UPI001CD64FF8